jgi:peptidyl-prolyl cis-trans isomerase C
MLSMSSVFTLKYGKRALAVLLATWIATWAPGCSRLRGGQKETSSKSSQTRDARGLSTDEASAILFRVGDRSWTVGQFAEHLATLSPYLRARYQSTEKRRELIDSMIQFELLAAEARRRGLEKRPEIQDLKNRLMVEAMLQAEIQKHVRIEDITQKEIETYYTNHPEEFHKPAQVRIAHILIADKNKAARVLTEALSIAQDDHERFDALVEKHSEDAATIPKQGDLNYVAQPSGNTNSPMGVFGVWPAVARAAFELQHIGDVSRSLVHTPAGYHIVRLTGRRNAIDLSLAEAHRAIQQRIWNEKREQWIQSFVHTLKAQKQAGS